MSVTLMRFKDGKPKPIKLSVWDAFKGVPIPKPRPHRIHALTKHEAGEAKPPEDVPKAEEKKPDLPEFTTEEDAKIKEMKAENATWNTIAEAIGNGRTKNDIKTRYKQLESGDEPKPEDKKDDSRVKKDDAKDKQEEGKILTKKEKAAKNREQGLKKKQEAANVKEAADKEKEAEEKKEEEEKKADSKEEAKPEPTPEQTKPADEAKTEVVPVNAKQKWIAAASKHFDRTGHRITPEQARKMAESST
ncbi:hypothetical protein LTR05_001395 [Lithohypha guttulata]|uniref:Myb-like domain-containing protein n=1 Tax=Lithohypha guttulata TaxID=1690604 RepID=A0AAN7TE16_9EURO|nr:hypothetical protein LTR05_001395 [Lithohypha guttulata]